MKTVVTSFTQNGWEVYGRACLESFRQHWPRAVRLVVFYEPDGPHADCGHIDADDVHQISDVEYWPAFDEWTKHRPLMCGRIGDRYNINFDARMARKTFIQCHALKQYGGKVFWLDADTITHSDVPEAFLDQVLPDDKFCCYLGRTNYHTESGFLGFNADHRLAEQFMHGYRQMFESGAIFTQDGWHDCYAFDAVRSIWEPQHPAAFNNLSANIPNEGAAHVFINSVLGKYCDHKKGARKTMARSPDSDLRVERTEAYWNG